MWLIPSGWGKISCDNVKFWIDIGVMIPAEHDGSARMKPTIFPRAQCVLFPNTSTVFLFGNWTEGVIEQKFSSGTWIRPH